MLKIMSNKTGLLLIALESLLIVGTAGIFAITAVKNGVGNLNYPIFYLNQNEIVQQTTIIQYITLLLACTLLFFFLLILIGYLLQYFF
ncbi:hypothetical protein ABQD61_13065, partial [Enterococcus asini]|uniref:hypothetical protein n=1 Tax=Enterococcus asini TaxID=57732 RepID=UPI0032E52064